MAPRTAPPTTFRNVFIFGKPNHCRPFLNGHGSHTRSPAAQTRRFSYPLDALGWPAARIRTYEGSGAGASGEVRLEIGSLYRLLGRLLNDGLLEMGDGDGRRQYYSLSRLGRKVL